MMAPRPRRTRNGDLIPPIDRTCEILQRESRMLTEADKVQATLNKWSRWTRNSSARLNLEKAVESEVLEEQVVFAHGHPPKKWEDWIGFGLVWSDLDGSGRISMDLDGFQWIWLDFN